MTIPDRKTIINNAIVELYWVQEIYQREISLNVQKVSFANFVNEMVGTGSLWYAQVLYKHPIRK